MDCGDDAAVDEEVGASDEHRGWTQRNWVAAAMSSGVPMRRIPALSTIARMSPPDSLLSSSRPIAVEITPGLMLLMRAPR